MESRERLPWPPMQRLLLDASAFDASLLSLEILLLFLVTGTWKGFQYRTRVLADNLSVMKFSGVRGACISVRAAPGISYSLRSGSSRSKLRTFSSNGKVVGR